jgi:hypothetical protein
VDPGTSHYSEAALKPARTRRRAASLQSRKLFRNPEEQVPKGDEDLDDDQEHDGGFQPDRSFGVDDVDQRARGSP